MPTKKNRRALTADELGAQAGFELPDREELAMLPGFTFLGGGIFASPGVAPAAPAATQAAAAGSDASAQASVEPPT